LQKVWRSHKSTHSPSHMSSYMLTHKSYTNQAISRYKDMKLTHSLFIKPSHMSKHKCRSLNPKPYRISNHNLKLLVYSQVKPRARNPYAKCKRRVPGLQISRVLFHQHAKETTSCFDQDLQVSIFILCK